MSFIVINYYINVKGINIKFFKELGIEAGMEPETARIVYYAMIRVLMREIKAGRPSRAPDWGVFELKERIPRNIRSVWDQEKMRITPKVITYDADSKLKEYVKNMSIEKRT